jgi:hypothetical protein
MSIVDVSNLKINLPGEVVQIFSNFRIKLANAGDLAKDQIKSFQDLIYESYKSNYVFFTKSITLAVQRMGKQYFSIPGLVKVFLNRLDRQSKTLKNEKRE